MWELFKSEEGGERRRGGREEGGERNVPDDENERMVKNRMVVVLCPGRWPSLCKLCPYRAFSLRAVIILCSLYSKKVVLCTLDYKYKDTTHPPPFGIYWHLASRKRAKIHV